MALKKGNKWIDGTGQEVPQKYVPDVDRKRDAMVEKLIRLAKQENERLAKLKSTAEEEISNFLTFLFKKYDTKTMNPGGNYTFTSFSGNLMVEITVNSFIQFDERLQLAKAKIDECITDWSENADDKIKLLIFDAFKVDKMGNVDTKRILALRSLKITDKNWKTAMDLINVAIKVRNKKEYIRFKRKNSKGKFETIPLDFANV